MFIAHLTACAFMLGVIWIIQCLHYPSFLNIDEKGFADFHQMHSSRMGYIVGPVMIFELVSGVWLFAEDPANRLLLLNLVLIVALWISTFAISVPLHNSLGKVHARPVIEKLIRTNWPRTVLWSVRMALLLYLANTTIGAVP